jgi:2-keto-4-pentenoate hydratase/2-oxohepta-3-ene-1,7-dioic acid hydratase in catechol pathway
VRIANLDGRATIVTDRGTIDVATASNGAFSASIDKCLSQLETLQAWFRSAAPAPTTKTTPEELQSSPKLGPIVAPRQVFAIGLNYRQHAAETGMDVPTTPMVFTKFPSAVCGPNADVPIPGPMTDYEAELVVVIGAAARNVREEDAFSVVAGYCVGQDYSERGWQRKDTPPQFSLGKSFTNFAPIGPWLTTLDDVSDPNDLAIGSQLNGVTMQDSRTSDLVFSVPQLIAYLSSVCALQRGDLIFTGTPQGVGQARTPPVFITPGDEVVTTIEGLGRLRNHATTP